MAKEIVFNPAPANQGDHCGLQFRYEIMHAAGPELPTASAVPVLPKALEVHTQELKDGRSSAVPSF